MSRTAKVFVTSQLRGIGIEVGGPEPWAPHVHDERLWARLLRDGTLGLGESYMEGWWDAEALDQFLFRLISGNIQDVFPKDLAVLWSVVRARLFNLQRLRVNEVGERHYDIGNELYSAMLDSRMIYSCGYWAEAADLEAAQEAKLDLICRKLGLRPGMHILDIGSGWGGLLKFAAERYGISGVGVTVSERQAAYARERCAGLPVEIRVQDYRALGADGGDDAAGFDRIFSLGMFEHVGVRNYRTYFDVVQRCLRDEAATGGGLFLLHTIGGNVSVDHTDPWIGRYIFPNSMLPSMRCQKPASSGVMRITSSIERSIAPAPTPTRRRRLTVPPSAPK